LSKQLLVLEFILLTSVYSAAGYDPNGIIDYYGTLSRAGEHNVIDATAFKVRGSTTRFLQFVNKTMENQLTAK
jgi:hypothetical protein